MLILAIDTSGQSGGITLAEADEKSFRAVESLAIAGGTFSAQLIPTLAALLKNHGYRAADIGGFAVASGPGSFTGLRVGLSAIKGLAETLRKPIATVSVLEAMAAMGDHQGKIAAAMDAGRKEVFLGVFEKTFFEKAEEKAGSHFAEKPAENSGQGITHQILIKQGETLLSQQDFVALLAAEAPAWAVTSDASLAEVAAVAGCAVNVVPRPGSEIIARIGAGKLQSGDTVSVEELDANYLRRSDAEIFFKGNAPRA